jgi:hypothetical protein
MQVRHSDDCIAQSISCAECISFLEYVQRKCRTNHANDLTHFGSQRLTLNVVFFQFCIFKGAIVP